MRASRTCTVPTPGHGCTLAWTPTGPRLVGSSALRVACRHCHAGIGQHCQRLVPRRGPVRLDHPHDVRITDAETDAEQLSYR